MFTAMEMDDTKRREWEAFNCAQMDLGMITPESTERWQDKVNEEEDVDRDQDERGMDDDDDGDKMPNAMKVGTSMISRRIGLTSHPSNKRLAKKTSQFQLKNFSRCARENDISRKQKIFL